ncbi:hypothetical protein BDFB_015120, partial [Asbolus verrucosus]
PLGRIIQLHPDEDNIVKVVSIQISKGVLKRCVSKLCALPLDKEDNEKTSQI